MNETLFRVVAATVAIALLAAPHWSAIWSFLAATAKASKAYHADAARLAAVCLLAFAVFGGGHVPHSIDITLNGAVTVLKVAVGLALIGQSISDVARVLLPAGAKL